MTDRELVDALRSTASRSKRKLLDAAADRIESTIHARTTIDDETIYGFPVRDLVVAATVMRGSGIEPEDLRKLCHNLDFAFNVAWEEWLPGMRFILTGEEMLYMCSNCTAKYEDVEGMRYCPNCGAKMDEVSR